MESNDQAAQNNTEAANQQTTTTTEQVNNEQVTAQAQPDTEIKYDLKLAEGAMLDQAYVEQFSQFAKENKLTQEMAQGFLNREQNLLNSYVQKQQQEFEATQKAWVAEIEKDPEIGGEKLKENVELAHRALKQFGSEKFLSELEQTGYGNHPELVRVFAKIGQLLKEDKMVSPNAQSGGVKTLEDIFYGRS